MERTPNKSIGVSPSSPFDVAATEMKEDDRLDISDIESGNLLEIFMRIHHSKFGTPS